MTIDFTAKKLKKRLDNISDPFEFEVLECLYGQYLSGIVDVNFIEGEPYFKLRETTCDALQLELPLEG